MPRVHSLASSVFSVQRPASRVQRPESKVQSPKSSVQSPASNSCVQSPGIPVCRLASYISLNFFDKFSYDLSVSSFKIFQFITSIYTLRQIFKARKSFPTKFSFKYIFIVRPKIGNREKHQGTRGKYPKKLGKQ